MTLLLEAGIGEAIFGTILGTTMGVIIVGVAYVLACKLWMK